MEEDKIKKDDNRESKKNDSLTKLVVKAMICTIIVLFNLFVIELYHVNVYESMSNADKPIIYIYSEKEQEVNVTLLDKDLLTCSYPKYVDTWKVLAKPGGELVDLDTGNKLYSLYYESKNKNDFKIEQEGFCVEKKDIANFLEEKLELLGLNYKEKEEFIVYWLPQLEKYDYVYIRFAEKEEIDNNMGLDINPKPDTLIRVMMTWRGLEKPIKVNEQKLTEVNRNGYTVVEWGGTEI